MSKSKKSAPVSEVRYVAKKQWPSGVRALVTKAAAKASTPTQVASVVAKSRKGYKASSALNCLRWLSTQGYVARVE